MALMNWLIALGYKSSVVKEFFLNYYSLNSDFTVDLSNGNISLIQKEKNKMENKSYRYRFKYYDGRKA